MEGRLVMSEINSIDVEENQFAYRYDTINKHISKKRHIKTLQNLLNTKIEYHFTFLIKSS